MRDELDDRNWDGSRSRFRANARALLRDLRAVFRRLVAIEYEAPWQVVARRKRQRC